MAHTAEPDFSAVFSIGPCSESLFGNFTCKALRALQRDVGNDELRHLIDSYLERYPIRAVDVEAYQYVALLHHYASIPRARVELPPATYAMVRGDVENAAHLHNEPRPGFNDYAARSAWVPQWWLGYGLLELAAEVRFADGDAVVHQVRPSCFHY